MWQHIEWTSDVTNNYEDLSELYDELLSVWSRHIGHVVTNVGGVFEDIKSPIKMELFIRLSLKHSNKKRSGYKLTLLLAYVVG
jgi:hypothetical protein